MKIGYYISGLCLMAILAAMPAGSLRAEASGSVGGKVIDAVSGEPLVGVTVVAEGQPAYSVTDINGAYLVSNIKPGPVKIVFQMMGYQTSYSAISLAPGQAVRINISMSYRTAEEMIVTAKRISNTEAALLSARKKAAVAQDAISSEQIAKSPDSNASDAAKRVVGITMDRDDRVIIRGLAERYSMVMLGDSTVPSPDPDRRIVPMDIFPVGLLDNLTVMKAYTPDMPGEFCGGVVKINPKDYPEDLTVSVSLGIGFHDQTTGKDFFTQKGGSWDWFGVDDGYRAIPKDFNRPPLDLFSLNSSLVPGILRYKVGVSMNNNYTPAAGTGYPAANFSVTAGDTYKINDKYSIGFLVSALYKNKFENRTTDYLRLNGNYRPLNIYAIKDSVYKTNKGVLLSFGFTSEDHKIRSTSFYTHNSKQSTEVQIGYNSDRQESGSLDIAKFYQLQHVGTDLLYTQLAGEHNIKPLYTTIDWSGSFARATYDEPDTRVTQLITSASAGIPGVFSLYRSDDAKRYWLDHEDITYDVHGGLTFRFKQWTGIFAKLKVGGGTSYQQRESSRRTFQWNNDGSTGFGNIYEPLEVFLGWPFIVGGSPVDANHFVLEEVTNPNDRYKGKRWIHNGFGLLDFPIVRNLRLVGGARYENSKMNLKTWDPQYLVYRDILQQPLKLHNMMPGVGLTYSPIDDINIRLAFSKTLARPDFRETVETKYQLLTKSAEILGNNDLQQTDIFNYDFRVEWFPSAGEIVSTSFFYKYMKKPIEMLEMLSSGGTELYTYKNAQYATNLGYEIEVRKNFAYGNEKTKNLLKNLVAFVNFTQLWSRIKVDYIEYNQNEYLNPSNLLEITPFTTRNRPLQGQSPWILNTGIEYGYEKSGTHLSLMYNMFGRRIVRVGTIRAQIFFEDVYEEPSGKLDLVFKQNILKYGHVKFTASNLIDQPVRQTQVIRHSSYLFKKRFTLESFRAGRSFSLAYTYSI